MELKDCPFCGSLELNYYTGWAKDQDRTKGGREPSLCCLNCDISFGIGYFGHGVSDEDVQNQMIKHWNKRIG